MPDHTAPPVIAQWLATALGGDAPQDARRLGWGFSNETWDVTTVHGRRLAVTRFAHPARAAPTARLMAAVAPRLAAVGVPVPQLVSVDGAGSGILTTTFIEGATGASLLGAAGGPVLVGRVMGTLWRQLRIVDAEGLPLATTPAAPGVLAASAEATLARLAASLPGLDVRRLSDSIRTVPALLKGRPSGFVHGDFVPANVLVREGAVVALLDFEAARPGDPLFDAAWFRWIVGYHHPEAAAAAWDAFRAAAEIDPTDPVVRELLRILPVVELLERLDATTAERETEHWLAMLRRTGPTETSFPSGGERKYGPTGSDPV